MDALLPYLSIILVLLIIAVILVVFVPAYLERRARANRAWRAHYAAALLEQEREARRLERLVIPYARGHSAHFSTGATAARERLATLLGELQAAQTLLDGLRLPEVFDYLLPLKHFFLVPRDAATIVADTRRVGQLRTRLGAVEAAAVEAQAAVEALAALPSGLAAERGTVARQLDAVEAAARAEQAAGVAEMDDIAREVARLRSLLARQAATASAALPDLDQGAEALEEAERDIDPLEAKMAALVAERARLDEQLQRVTAELDNVQAVTKSGPDATAPAQARPLLRRAAALLNESAPAHRSRRDYAAATADVAAAARFIAMARDLSAADGRARLLAERDDGVSLAGPIAEARRQLDTLLDQAAEDAPPSAAREAALVARAADTRRQMEALVEQQNGVIAGLERDAAAARDQATAVWEAGQRLLRLAADDPLARRYNRLLAEVDAARRHPTALEKLREEAAAFEATLGPWTARVQDNRRRVTRLRERIPEQIDTALATAAPWACLADHVAFIQQRAADFETTQARFAGAHYRRTAEEAMDQLEAIEKEIEARLALLTEQAGRLRFLESDVDQIITLAATDAEALSPEDPSRAKRERALSLVAHHTAQAHAAARYEDASLALSRAADLANRLAL